MKMFVGSVLIATMLSVLGCSQEARTPNHLIMLTEAAGGENDASFMTVEALEECETRARVAINVFPAANIKYISHYCTHAEASFEPFGHNPEPTGPNYIFDLKFSKDGKALKKVVRYTSMQACHDAKGKTCVISYQDLL